MRLAVTGGSGFIGAHVVDRLLDAGHSVVVVDAVPPHRADVGYQQADITRPDDMVSALQGFDGLFHLAAVSNVNDVFDNPVAAVTSNVLGTTNVCEAARVHGLQRVVLASTVWVYGAAHGEEPLDEASPFDLTNSGHLYTSTKLASELVVLSYQQLYGLPFTILRYGIPYGPRMRDALVIPQFVRKVLAGETITINGDGLQFRNYVYVEDLADAHLRCLQPAGENEIFNLEGTEEVSIRRVMEAIQEILGHPVAVDFLAARPGDFRGRQVSADKAHRLLGWEPGTSFADGLRRYVDWYRATKRPQDGMATAN